jgi:general L-amino acid transport system permease protein
MISYVRKEDAPLLMPPPNLVGLGASLRQRFFPTPVSGVAGILIAALVIYVTWLMIDWALIRAVWSAPDRELCNAPGAGACWPFAVAKAHQWVYGFYPFEERWRVNIVFLIGAIALVCLLIPSLPYKGWTAFFMFGIYPVISFFLLVGGYFGLTYVETTQWGGLLVTLVLSLTSMVMSFPLGILLALGRRSTMPIVSLLSTVFIEVVRGVPLVLVLFMAANMFPLFMPPGVNPDKLLIAMLGMGLFASAYMAEIFRGGLQAIPKGQYEGAQAVGLSYWKMMLLVVMPQAIKIVIPSIVSNFIGLFKDTSLVTTISILDMLGIMQTGFNDAKWASAQTANTGYFVLAVVFWVFCFAMSRYSQFIERKLNTGHKR